MTHSLFGGGEKEESLVTPKGTYEKHMYTETHQEAKATNHTSRKNWRSTWMD